MRNATTLLSSAFFFCLCSSCGPAALGQSRGLVSTAGSIVDNDQFSLVWNIGEAIAGNRDGLLVNTHYRWEEASTNKNLYPKLNLKISPTIVSEYFTLEIDEKDLPAQLKLFATDGLLMLKTPIHSTHQRIHLPKLKAAMYVVTVTSGQKQFSAKLIKP